MYHECRYLHGIFGPGKNLHGERVLDAIRTPDRNAFPEWPNAGDGRRQVKKVKVVRPYIRKNCRRIV